MSYARLPRNLRPARRAALEALQRYLNVHPDLRIGQALRAATGEGDVHLFYIEDEDLIEALTGEPYVPPPAPEPPCSCGDYQCSGRHGYE